MRTATRQLYRANTHGQSAEIIETVGKIQVSIVRRFIDRTIVRKGYIDIDFDGIGRGNRAVVDDAAATVDVRDTATVRPGARRANGHDPIQGQVIAIGEIESTIGIEGARTRDRGILTIHPGRCTRHRHIARTGQRRTTGREGKITNQRRR